MKLNKKIITKKDMIYSWVAFVLLLFSWVPLLGIFLFLPGTIIFCIKQLKLIQKYPKKHGGKIFTIVILICSILALILGIIVFIYSLNA